MKPNYNPTVDVIIPAYMQGQFLSQAIDSILGQTYPHVGVTVVDDGSPDETPAVAASYGDRIRYIRKQNAGVAAARNTGILESKADFLLFMDSDDYLRPDTLERHMEAVRANPTGTIFHGSCQYVDEAGRNLDWYVAKSLGDEPLHTLLTGNQFSPHSLMIRRSAFAKAGMFDGSTNGSEDWEMWIRLAAAGFEFVPVPDAVAFYRFYAGNTSKRWERTWLGGLKVLEKSRGYHEECALCRRAIAKGIRNLRSWCFHLLTEEVEGAMERGEAWSIMAKAARRQIQTPCRPAAFVRVAPRYLLRMAVRRLRQSPAEAVRTS